MTAEERSQISDFKKCNFKKMHTYFLGETEKRKSRTKEQKQVIIFYTDYYFTFYKLYLK